MGGHVEASSGKGRKGDDGTAAAAIQGEAEQAGTIQPGEQKAQMAWQYV